MKKYYYNGELVRTSKTRTYKYGLLTTDNCIVSCSATPKALESEIRTKLTFYKKQLDYYTKHNDIENIDWYKNVIENVNNYRIVELEEREEA